jgi:hypothetical protein
VAIIVAIVFSMVNSMKVKSNTSQIVSSLKDLMERIGLNK